MIRKVIIWFVVAVVLLAIWRASGGSIEGILNSLWGIIEAGADIVRRIWDAIVPIANEAANSGGSEAPAS